MECLTRPDVCFRYCFHFLTYLKKRWVSCREVAGDGLQTLTSGALAGSRAELTVAGRPLTSCWGSVAQAMDILTQPPLGILPGTGCGDGHGKHRDPRAGQDGPGSPMAVCFSAHCMHVPIPQGIQGSSMLPHPPWLTCTQPSSPSTISQVSPGNVPCALVPPRPMPPADSARRRSGCAAWALKWEEL